MMTVRHVLPDGDEHVVQIDNGAYHAKDCRFVGQRPGDLQMVVFTSGCIYVMNEHGKTVAVYDFQKLKKK